MSTVEATRPRRSGRSGFRARLLAIGALIAIGATALVLALTSAHHAAKPHAAVVTRGSNAAPTLASVLAHLNARERQDVLGIMSMSKAQQAAAYGTVK